MAASTATATALEDSRIPVKIKIAALWVSVMLCYIYGDYFGLYKPGTVEGMLDGRIEPIGRATQVVLLGAAAMMAIPSVMVFLSVALRPKPNRALNIVFGTLYTIIIAVTMLDAWAFYILLGVVEIALTIMIVWYAWNWPRRSVSIAENAAVP